MQLPYKISELKLIKASVSDNYKLKDYFFKQYKNNEGNDKQDPFFVQMKLYISSPNFSNILANPCSHFTLLYDTNLWILLHIWVIL